MEGRSRSGETDKRVTRKKNKYEILEYYVKGKNK